MEPRRRALLLFLLVLVVMGRAEAQGGALSPSFYSSTCPNVEGIVKQAVAAKFAQTFTTIPGTLRLFFHDCFVEGCDASMMIFSPSNDADKDAQENLSIATDGFDTVIKAKDAVEAACPGVVSCADVIALAARDVVVLVGGPSFSVELGRRDGRVSQASRVPGKLPQPSFNLDQLNALFGKNGLSQTDLIALSGAHTLGFSHCTRILDRIYSVPVDPFLDPDYAQELMAMCPRNPHPDLAINMDPTTPRVFDNGYYKNLVNQKGLFRSDQVLFTDQRSRNVVTEFAARPDEFARAFATAMVNLGRFGVKTGTEGEVRRDCTSFN